MSERLPELRFNEATGQWEIIWPDTGEVLFADDSHQACVIRLADYRKAKT